MKKLLYFLLFISLGASAQVPLAGYIKPIGPTDTYPLTIDSLAKGGFRVVTDATERNAIPAARRKIGMFVLQQSDSTVYRLQQPLFSSGITLANKWVAFNTGYTKFQVDSIAGKQTVSGQSLYLMATFDNSQDNQLKLFGSTNGKNFGNLATKGIFYTKETSIPNGRSIRDPSIVYYNNKYYVAHTGNFNNLYLEVSSNLKDWSLLATIPGRPSGVTATYNCWAPDFLVDDSGVYLYYSYAPADGSANFKLAYVKATSTDLSTWSTETDLTGTVSSLNGIDPNVTKIGSTYYMYYKNETTKYIERATSTSPTAAFNTDKSGEWAGFGANVEGPDLVVQADGSYTLYFDHYTYPDATKGIYYSSSADQTTWTTPAKAVSEDGSVLRHCSVFRTSNLNVLRNISATSISKYQLLTNDFFGSLVFNSLINTDSIPTKKQVGAVLSNGEAAFAGYSIEQNAGDVTNRWTLKVDTLGELVNRFVDRYYMAPYTTNRNTTGIWTDQYGSLVANGNAITPDALGLNLFGQMNAGGFKISGSLTDASTYMVFLNPASTGTYDIDIRGTYLGAPRPFTTTTVPSAIQGGKKGGHFWYLSDIGREGFYNAITAKNDTLATPADIRSAIATSTPTLQKVTTAGATSTNPITVKSASISTAKATYAALEYEPKQRIDSLIAAIPVQPTPTLQSVTAAGNTTTLPISASSFSATGTAGAGMIDFLQQSVSPISTTGHLKIYADSLNRLSWKNSTYRRTLRITRAADMTISFPYSLNPVLGDSIKIAGDIQLKQPRVYATFTPFNGTPAAGDSVQRVAEKLQYQIATTIPATYTPQSRNINTGYGLLGGGNLTADRTLVADTSATGLSPKSYTNNFLTKAGAVATYVPQGRTITNGYGLTPLGAQDLSVNRTIAVDTAGSIVSKGYLSGYTYTKSASDAKYSVNPMTTLGDIIVGGTGGAQQKLAGNTTTSRFFLTSIGDGTNATVPTYFNLFGTSSTWSAGQTFNGVLMTNGIIANTKSIATSTATQAQSNGYFLGYSTWNNTAAQTLYSGMAWAPSTTVNQAGRWYFYTNSTASNGNSGGAENLTLYSGGDVGIGTGSTDPGFKLGVSGTFNVTGVATGLTPANGDNSTKFATTAFVNASIGVNQDGQATVSTTSTITYSATTSLYYINGSSITVTLPSASNYYTSPIGKRVTYVNNTQTTQRINANGTETFPFINGSGSTYFLIPPMTTVVIEAASASSWYIISFTTMGQPITTASNISPLTYATEYVTTNNSGQTLTLPPVDATAIGKQYQIIISNTSTGTTTVNSNAGGNDIKVTTTGVASDTITSGGVATYTLYNNSGTLTFKRQ